MSNTVALIQAGMNHPVLPCGPMLCLHGMPMIDWVVHRLRKARLVDHIAVVTSGHPMDDVLAWHLENQGVEVFRNHTAHELEGFYQAAEATGATELLRIGWRVPMVWGPEIDALIEFFREGDYDLAYNHDPMGNLYPRGIGGEMVSLDFLKGIRGESVLPERGDIWFWAVMEHANAYKIGTFDPADSRLRQPDKRLFVENPQAYRKFALMPIHPDMHPAEILMRYPRQE